MRHDIDAIKIINNTNVTEKFGNYDYEFRCKIDRSFSTEVDAYAFSFQPIAKEGEVWILGDQKSSGGWNRFLLFLAGRNGTDQTLKGLKCWLTVYELVDHFDDWDNELHSHYRRIDQTYEHTDDIKN